MVRGSESDVSQVKEVMRATCLSFLGMDMQSRTSVRASCTHLTSVAAPAREDCPAGEPSGGTDRLEQCCNVLTLAILEPMPLAPHLCRGISFTTLQGLQMVAAALRCFPEPSKQFCAWLCVVLWAYKGLHTTAGKSFF